MMEDEYIINHDIRVSKNLRFSVFAVFDGHGGKYCSLYLKQNFITELKKALTSSNFSAKEHFYTYLQALLTKFFKKLDKSFHNSSYECSLRQGSTAVVVLVIGDRIICANVGDSRAILSRKGCCIALSQDHTPDKKFEKERIEKAGGKVELDRINGNLAISRAFGDFLYKKNQKSSRLGEDVGEMSGDLS